MLTAAVRVFFLSILAITTSGALPAAAQDPDADPERLPIPRFVADARGVFATYPDAPAIATFLKVTQDNVPTRGLGLVFGAHVYPLRLGPITVGVGGEVLFTRGSRSTTLKTTDNPPKEVESPTVNARLDGLTPQLSLNFGRRAGWSYVSAGLGSTTYRVEIAPEDRTAPTVPAPPSAPAATDSTDESVGALNYGGGARWFFKKRLAFSFDIRYYTVRPHVATATRPALPRKRLVMLSAGLSFR